MNPFVLERVGKFANQIRIAFDDQDARFARRIDKTGVGVVVQQRVFLEPGDAHTERGQTITFDRLLKAEAVFAGLELLGFADHFVVATKDFDQSFVFMIRLDDNIDKERFSFSHLRGHVDFRHLDLRFGHRRQRNRRDRNVTLRRRSEGIPCGLIAVAEQDNLRHITGRHVARSRLDRRGQVGSVEIPLRLAFWLRQADAVDVEAIRRAFFRVVGLLLLVDQRLNGSCGCQQTSRPPLRARPFAQRPDPETRRPSRFPPRRCSCSRLPGGSRTAGRFREAA